MSIESTIKTLSLKYFDGVGFSKSGTPRTIAFYEEWLARGEHGEMDYLRRHLEKKRQPQLLLEGARSWIVLLLSYDSQEDLSVERQEEWRRNKKGWIARYARGRDYHTEIGERHRQLMTELSALFPGERFLSCVDTKAVLERDAAAQAGLGWIGKNTCLINQDMGSFVFLSEILTTLSLVPNKPVADHCGRCQKCLEACPTGALVGPHHLDARKCISYWTIETDAKPPDELARKFGPQIFGCDICQDVCPWNQKARRQRPSKEPAQGFPGVFDLRQLVEMDSESLETQLKDTALERAGGDHLKQNARIALNDSRAIL